MGNREMIERALAQFYKDIPHYGQGGWMYDNPELDIDALAKQAIVIECEVRHSVEPVLLGDFTTIGFPGATFRRAVNLDGHHGIPGKYLFFGLPLEEEDGDNQG